MFFLEDAYAKAFEDEMDSLKWKTCKGCNERFLTTDASNVKCLHKNKCWHFSSENNMDPGPVPEELQGLTFIEQQLVALTHPFISVFKLKGIQFGYRGHVINFPQDVHSFAEIYTVHMPDAESSLPNTNDSSVDSWLKDAELPASCLPFAKLPNQDEQAIAFLQWPQLGSNPVNDLTTFSVLLSQLFSHMV